MLSVLALFVAVVAAIGFIVGPARLWSLFGPADLGSVVFEQLQRRITPNDALACPAGLCPATADMTPPVFAVDATALRSAMAKVVASEADLTRVDTSVSPRTDRYVQRSALMQFPDTIVVRYIDVPGGRSTLAIYSRSQFGRSDFGVNKARIERWLGKLSADLPR